MQIFEVLMMFCFGAAWPPSIYKSYTSRQTAGKSLIFMFIILTGYFCGIINKIVNGADYVIVLYIINSLMVTTDILLYFRNKRINATEKNN